MAGEIGNHLHFLILLLYKQLVQGVSY